MRGCFSVLPPVLLLALALSVSYAQSASTTIELEVVGGEHEGEYSATSAEPTCSYGYAGEGMWGNQYSLSTARPDEFSSLQLIVDAARAKEGTDYFLATVSFGQFFTEEETTYHFRSGSQEGRGEVTLEDRGSSATVTISAITDDGVRIEATIECHKVLRTGGDSRRDDTEKAAAGPVELRLGDRSFEFIAGYDEAYCEESIAEEGDFQYGFQATDYEEAEVHGIELYLLDLSGPAEFYLSIYLGDQSYTVDTMDAEGGAGTVHISSRGGSRVIEIEGITGDGEPLSLRAECATD